MSSHDTPSSSPPSPPSPPSGLVASVCRVVWMGLRDAFRSRRSILHQHYLTAALAQGESLDPALDLEQLRGRYLEVLRAKSVTLAGTVEAQESAVVTVTRWCAWWLVGWMVLLPAALTAIIAFQMTQDPKNSPALIAIMSALLFGFMSFCGLFLQSFLGRPMTSFVNRWITSRLSKSER